MRKEYLDKVRRLTLFLMISGSMNILTAATLGYYYFKERPPTPLCEGMPARTGKSASPVVLEYTNNETIRLNTTLTMEQLIEKLHDRRRYKDGFSNRDIALGCLVALHYFDLAKALTGERLPMQKLTIAYEDAEGRKGEIPIFSDLTENHYRKILAFVQTEQWPLTAEGLFYSIQKQRGVIDKNLRYAFYLTPEFLAVSLLFKRANIDVSRSEILDLLTQGSWEMLSEFVQRQRFSQDLSHDQLIKFLLGYLEKESSCAVSMLLKADPYTTSKKLEHKEQVPIRYQSNRIGAKPLEEPKPLELPPAKPTKQFKKWKRAYTIKEGDSLWKISRMFNIDVEELKRYNNLNTDALAPGSMILVP